jgi:hypothetical protein
MDDDFENGFRHDLHFHRALKWKRRRATTKPKTRPVRTSLNEGKPIEITHIGMPKRGRIVPFLYHEPPRQGYADLYFVAPDSLIDFWLTKHGRAFYESPSPELNALLARREFYALASPVSARHGDTLVRNGVELYLCSGKKQCSLGYCEDLLACRAV